jgi:hypothetical protein
LPDCNEISKPDRNLKAVDLSVKRKRQAFADFLGVPGFPGQVVDALWHSDNNFDLL